MDKKKKIGIAQHQTLSGISYCFPLLQSFGKIKKNQGSREQSEFPKIK